MLATNEDVERNQEDDSKKTVFNLRNLLIFSGSLVALAVVLILVWLGTTGNASLSYQPSFSTLFNRNTPSELVIFQYDRFIHTVNPMDSELKSRCLFNDKYTLVSNIQFSKDKKRLYFYSNGICMYDFESSQVQDFSAFNVHDFLIRKPDLNSILYGIKDDTEKTSLIRHWNIKESKTIKDYPTKCGDKMYVYPPAILGQTFDGSKVLYTCVGQNEYFLKTLDDSDAQDQKLFTLYSEFIPTPLFSPDGSKMILIDFRYNFWQLIDLNSVDPIAERQPIYFNVGTKEFQNLTLSDNMKTLYFVIRNENECKLYAINYKSLFENNYFDPQSPFDIGQGRTIELGTVPFN